MHVPDVCTVESCGSSQSRTGTILRPVGVVGYHVRLTRERSTVRLCHRTAEARPDQDGLGTGCTVPSSGEATWTLRDTCELNTTKRRPGGQSDDSKNEEADPPVSHRWPKKQMNPTVGRGPKTHRRTRSMKR
eukprot:scaffold544_cov320-Pavlova_lutheri.AAC.19